MPQGVDKDVTVETNGRHYSYVYAFVHRVYLNEQCLVRKLSLLVGAQVVSVAFQVQVRVTRSQSNTCHYSSRIHVELRSRTD
jgi:hypothetical protein